MSPPTAGSSTPRLESVAAALLTTADRHPGRAAALEWDDPALAIDPSDPRWALPDWDPLSRTAWYQDLPPASRSTVGLGRAVDQFRAGVDFEALLHSGFTSYLATAPAGPQERAFICRELEEEAEHTSMFLEFIRRSQHRSVPNALADQHAAFTRLGRDQPSLLLLSILAGEEAFDHVQRRLVDTAGTHPLLVQVCQRHIVDEARHLSFARVALRSLSEAWSPSERRALELQLPFVLRLTAETVLHVTDLTAASPPPPPSVVKECRTSPAARDLEERAFRRVRSFCRHIGLRSR